MWWSETGLRIEVPGATYHAADKADAARFRTFLSSYADAAAYAAATAVWHEAQRAAPRPEPQPDPWPRDPTATMQGAPLHVLIRERGD